MPSTRRNPGGSMMAVQQPQPQTHYSVRGRRNVAQNLSDEVIEAILDLVVNIPDDDFIPSSYRDDTRFGYNEVSTSSVLLVCKRWMRIATPLLYSTAVIRSTGQAQALADAAPRFGKYLKRLRLQGAYSGLSPVFQHCCNIQILCLSVDIFASDAISSLIKGLSKVDPKRLVLSKHSYNNNRQYVKFVTALGEAIRNWKKIERVDFYGEYNCEGAGLYACVGQSPTISVASVDAFAINQKLLLELSRAPKLCRIDVRGTLHPWKMSSIQNDAHLLCLINYVRGPKASRFQVRSSDSESDGSESDSPSTPDRSFPARLQLDEKCWGIVIKFAVDRYDHWPIHHPKSHHHQALNRTRNAIALTSKMFNRLVKPLIFHFPLISSRKSLNLFIKLLNNNRNIGSQVRAVDLCSFTPVASRFASLIKHVKGIQSIGLDVGNDDILPLCGKIAPTLTSMSISLKCSITSFPELPVLTTLVIDGHMKNENFVISNECFPRLEGLILRCSSEWHLLKALEHCQLPCLKRFTSTCTGNATEEFLLAHGKKLEEVRMGSIWSDYRVLELCPNLQTLEIGSPPDQFPKMGNFIPAADNATLKEILIREPVQKAIKSTSTFFEEFARQARDRLTALESIMLAGSYKWPQPNERSISQDKVVMWAIKYQRDLGVTIKDSRGKVWKPRVERRR